MKIKNIKIKSTTFKKWLFKKLINKVETINCTKDKIKANIYIENIILANETGVENKNSDSNFSCKTGTRTTNNKIKVDTIWTPVDDQIKYMGLIFSKTKDNGIDKNK